ncbi:MAG TPA: TetR/AcrR family transcriptional regulator [Rhodocyclaceae bacterium]|jgi:AcrR family transcriptional regulator|nr:TetR/AcrR family transcriptional regulator [Rhodocyclaceae bacterium]
MSAKKPERKVTSAADAQNQILAAVDELFYREGARAVGVEAVVQRAGVNKMSLYRQFESKDGLLLHYLARRDETFWGYVEASIAKHPGQPRQQLLQFMADLARRAQREGYRGCPFVNIAVEFPDPEHPARLAVADNKSRLLARLQTLAEGAGAVDAPGLARMLLLLIEGAYTASQTCDSKDRVLTALVPAAEVLIAAACGEAG